MKLSRRSMKDLAGGTSLGCGLGLMMYTMIVSLSGTVKYYGLYQFLFSTFIGLTLTFMGLRSLRWVEVEKARSKTARIFRSLGATLGPVPLGGIVLGLTIMTVPTILSHADFRIFWHMGVAAAAAVPHMFLYLTYDSEAVSSVATIRDTEARSDLGGTASPGGPTKRDDVAPTPPAEVEERYAARTREGSQLTYLRGLLTDARSRLQAEIGALGRRGNLNLAIGVFATVAAIVLLAYVVLGAQGDFQSTPSILSYYVPRISFVVFVEVFAFFFLRLYKANLDGIKYFQNELTNVEMKFISIEAALLGNPSEHLLPLLSDIVKTERNFILKQGEATVEIRKAELERDLYKGIITPLAEVIAKTKGK